MNWNASRFGYQLSQLLVEFRTKTATWYFTDRHYHARINPFDLIWIDPTTVERGLMQDAEQEFRFSNAIPEVVGGDWDLRANSFQDYYMYESFVDRFRHSIPWKETVLWDRVNRELEEGRTKWGCNSPASLRERLAKLDRLYEAIAEDGYNTQRELRKDISSDPTIRDIHRYWPPELHEVCVNIGRNGEFIFQDGRHRLIIAQLLNLSEIPVRVKVRHSIWQARRDASLQTKEHNRHPDLSA